MPVTEKLKSKLLDKYQKEYEQFLPNKEAERARELEKAREALKDKLTDPSSHITLRIDGDPNVQPTAPDISFLDQVVYPNDFPSGSNRSETGLLLPETDKKPVKPSIDRSQKPSTDSLLEGSLRTVVIPQNTMSIFLNLANKNTINNIETCGILAGRLAYNRLIITHVIIPKQHGTSDSCTTTNEEEINI